MCLLVTGYHESKMDNHLLNKHSDVLKDEGADVLFLLTFVTLAEDLTCNQSLHPQCVDLVDHLRLFFLARRRSFLDLVSCSSC